MSTIRLSHQSYEGYDCIEVPKGTKISPEILDYLKKRVQRAREKNKKMLITLPGNTAISSRCRSEFASFFQQSKEGCLFIPQEALKWGNIWEDIVVGDMSITEMDKALAWVMDENFLTPKIVRRELNNVIYIKFSGNVAVASKHASKKIIQSLDEVKPKGRLLANAEPFDTGIGITWVPIANALILDIADVFMLNQRLMGAIIEGLAHHKLDVSTQGIYFVTSGLFQSWQLKELIKGKPINEIGNIIRVVSNRATSQQENIDSELKAITKTAQSQDPPIPLMLHQIKGSEAALKTIDYFSPDLVIVDEISEATSLKQNVLKSRAEKINHIIPASDPGLRILSPQMITKGYDHGLFAEYVLSRYKHNRGKPNETYIYYLTTDPEHMRKVSIFLSGELSHVLDEKTATVIEKLAACETNSNAQGSFTVSLLETQFLKFEIDLYFTTKGFSDFLGQYTTLFDHRDSITSPIRLYLRAAKVSESIHSTLHLADNYNEFYIREPNIDIEVRTQDNKNILIFKALPHEGLETRFKTLFTLLNSSNIFDFLPDKELFIELVSLLWENYQASMYRTQGFTISLISSNDGSFELEIFQSKQNKGILRCKEVDGKPRTQFTGTFLHHPQSQRRLLKIISLFFIHDKEDPTENNWRFACFEALAQIVANGSQNQSLSFDFQLHQPRWSAVFICDSKAPNSIADRSRKVFQDGAKIVNVDEACRQVALVRNPTAQEEEQSQSNQLLDVKSELDNLKEDAILEKVADVKNQEAVERSLKLQQSYEEALKAYNKKYGGLDEEENLNTSKIVRPKTLEEATRTKVIMRKRKSEADLIKQRKKIRTYAISIISFISIFAFIFMFFNFSGRSDIDDSNIIRPSGGLTEEQELKMLEKMDTQKVKSNKRLAKDPAKSIILYVCQKLYVSKAPDQELLNALLKELYQSKEKYADSGDLQNLMARLFWYKIHLDHEDIFVDEWKKKWKKQAYEHFSEAKKLYQRETVNSNIALRIQEWMPEYYVYKSLPENEKVSIIYAKYKDTNNAMVDVDALMKKVQ